ncbi:amidohydrolase family protein [Sulfuracidifex tepidarius]|uniref:5'-deoxyadenosine deaminase n=2 Tax=Sulfuracidifex tepidarius TaxID=1294262 RepID=A0A510E6A1_9CREN|nr:amidohydrolase family protein [Sulfuracidifex tepidarius]BBG25279.1 5'-deoxyadenosine deaminase [Sulfuracidifex tepidarius]BBG28073.1 5'-deoxyadenosine deaminase [Sulfuracidifex tepidarius]
MQILLKSGVTIGSDKPMRNANVGIEDGIIKGVSTKELEGFEYPDLEVGGKNRLVSPAMVVMNSFLYLYPFRYRVFTGKLNPQKVIDLMSSNDVYYFALAGAYHLLKRGVGTVVFSGPHLDLTARAVSEVGIRPVLAVTVDGENDWEKEFSTLYNRWSSGDENRVILRLCDQESVRDVLDVSRNYHIQVLVDRDVDLSNADLTGTQVIGLGGGSRKDLNKLANSGSLSWTPSFEVSNFPLSKYKPSLSLDLTPSFDPLFELKLAVTRLLLVPEEAFNSATLWGYSQLGRQKYGKIEVGYIGDISIFELNEPPAFPLDSLTPYESMIFSIGYPETVIVNGDAVLDGGAPINVGLKEIERIRDKVNEFEGTVRDMEKN